jgi:AcrR family transcriptional regulator
VHDALPTTDRRVRRTRRSLQEAFVALVLERGYDKVSVDDITSRADVARPTFYAHYAAKDDLLTAVFSSLLDDLVSRLEFRSETQTAVRTEMVEELYRHAGEFRDLYRVCLSGAGDGRARDAYMDLLTHAVERNFSERVRTLGSTPRVPLFVMARAFVGAHVALLESWLEGEIDMPSEELVSVALDLLVAGFAWGHGLAVDEVRLSSDHELNHGASGS